MTGQTPSPLWDPTMAAKRTQPTTPRRMPTGGAPRPQPPGPPSPPDGQDPTAQAFGRVIFAVWLGIAGLVPILVLAIGGGGMACAPGILVFAAATASPALAVQPLIWARLGAGRNLRGVALFKLMAAVLAGQLASPLAIAILLLAWGQAVDLSGLFAGGFTQCLLTPMFLTWLYPLGALGVAILGLTATIQIFDARRRPRR